MYAIEAENLTKTYLPPKGLRAMLIKSPIKKEVIAVKNVNLQVKKGEIFGFLGPNGAGKTTLIKMLTTLLHPTSGKAAINGYDVVKQQNEARNSVGLVTGEERSFYLRLTGKQNLEFFANLYGFFSKEAEKRIDFLLEQLGLADAADNMFYSYSSGMKQKLSLARGLLCDPAVLFLDEPTKSVDVMTSRSIRHFIKETLVKKEKRVVFLTTHRLEEAEAMCDRVAIVNKGSIRFCGTVAELHQRIYKKDRFKMSVDGIKAQQIKKLFAHNDIENLIFNDSDQPGIVNVTFSVLNGNKPQSQIVKNVITNGGNLISLNKMEPKLEEMFTDFFSRDVDAKPRLKETSDVVS